MGQTGRSSGAAGSEAGLRWSSGRSPEDGVGGGWSRSGALTATLAGTDTEAPNDDDKGHDEGGTSDVEGPAGHESSGRGDILSAVQLCEVLEVGEVRLMKT